MNLAEDSLNQKIRNYAKLVGENDVNRIRATVALERLVARINANPFLDDKLVFCGGFVLYKEGITDRYTKDVDMISSGKDHKQIIFEIKKSIESDLGDGFWFGDIEVDEINEDILYGGIRFKPSYKIGLPFPDDAQRKKLRKIHLDLSFQVLYSDMKRTSELKSELEFYEELSWKIYPLEYIASDKIHAILSRAGLSTRSKDVYDLSFILPQCDKAKLNVAITYTFNKRNTELGNTLYFSFENIGHDLLKSNWRKINFKINRKSFEQCWKELLDYFQSF